MVDPQFIVLAVLITSVVLFVTDALRYDLIAILVAWVLAVTGCLTPTEAFAGFSSEAIVVIACMYVFGQATSRWGIAEFISQKLIMRSQSSESGLTLRITTVAGLMSTILSNTGVVATLIPVLGSVARQSSLAVSRLLMPLCFGSLAGGMVTVIGTSTNVAVNGAIVDQGEVPFALFEFAHLGLILLAITAFYFVWPGRQLLPRSRTSTTLSEHYQVPKFVTEVLVDSSSALINRVLADAHFFDKYDVTVLGIVRAEGGGTMLAPGPYNRIRTEDVLMVQGEPDAILRLRSDLGLRQRDSVNAGSMRLDSPDVLMVETVVPATSPLIGRTLVEANFQDETGINVLAISKHGDVTPAKIGHTVLSVGDTLLIQGHQRDVDRLRDSRYLLVLSELDPPVFGRGALITCLMLGLVLLLSSMGLDLSMAALTGTIGLLLTGCLRAHEVRNAIDWSVLILIGGMLALGRAFEHHGLGHALAEWIAGLGATASNPVVILSVLILVTTLMTQVMNHVTAAVIMTPVAISLATEFDVSNRPLLLGVIVGANLAFMSPVAHQANAMVMGPGDYKYKDFLRVGAPLTIILAAASIFLIPVWWPF
ncbi:MAG: di/tricarboxylate transporter [Planctomycetota bacterium]|jgi:di/tricarboxylate transporter